MKDSSRDALLASERAFHNERFAEGDGREAQLKYYWAIARGAKRYTDEVLRLSSGRDVLEYGCGSSDLAARLGPIARSVEAIDISDVAIARLREACSHANVSYEVMDAMAMAYPDASFDLVFGSGIIHHLDVEASAAEIARVLRPGGTALFWEPLGLNPAIELYRAMTPNARTPDEHPLLPRDFATLRRYFPDVKTEFHGLTSLAAVPLRNTGIGNAARQALSRVDDAIFSIPGIRWTAWYSIIRCSR